MTRESLRHFHVGGFEPLMGTYRDALRGSTPAMGLVAAREKEKRTGEEMASRASESTIVSLCWASRLNE